jgi:thiamine-monophosphate kinase
VRVEGAGDSDSEITVAALGEDALVGSVIARYAASPSGVLVGPGDDAAVLEMPGRVVISTDTLVEGYDFLRKWSTAHDVGVKTAAQNLADIAAMGATPVALVVSVATPAELPATWARELADGLADECARAGAAVVGGDVSQATEIVITATALGLLTGPAVLRGGARPKDVVALAGATGFSAAGLALLRAETGGAGRAVLARLVRAHLAPRPGYSDGPVAAAAGATAMIDTSDGLLRDARRVAKASEVVLDLDSLALAPGEDLRAAATALGSPAAAMDWVLSGGEDHALLACFPLEVPLPAPFRRIGLVRADPEAGVLVDGRPYHGAEGWQHFR